MAVTWQMVRDAFETTDGVMPPAQARENLAKALAPLFSGTGPGGAVNTVTATGRIVATPSDGTGDVVLTHADSGVLSGTYGSSTQIPVFTVDATGHITLASTAAVATPSSIPWANLTGFPSVTAGNGLIGGGYLAGSVTLSVVFAGSGSANAVSRSDHRHDLQTGALDGVLPVSRGGTAISSPGSVPGNLRWNGSNYIVDFTVFATASSLADYLPLAGGNMSGPIHALGTGNNSDIVLDVFSTGQTFARLALNHYGEIVFGDGTGGVGPIVSFDTSSTKLDIRNYGVKCVDLTTGAIDQTGQLYNHQTNAGILTSAQLNGGDLLLSGNSGTANIKICGSIAANTAGVAPYMYFAGQPNGVGLTGGGMMFQLNSTNGLDLWSWNNTAWVRKSTITSSGTIALVGGTSSQVMKADGTVGKVAFSTDMSGTLQASQFPGLTGDVTAPAGSFDTTLKSIITAGGYVGSSSTVPMIRWDSKGRLTGVDSVSISPLAIGALALTGGTISGPLTLQSNLILPRGSFRDLVGSTSYTAYYGSYVIPTANNYSIAVNQSGADTTLNGSNLVLLCVNNAAVLNATATGVAVSGVLSSTGAISTSSSVISGNAKMAPWSVSPGTFAFLDRKSVV